MSIICYTAVFRVVTQRCVMALKPAVSVADYYEYGQFNLHY